MTNSTICPKNIALQHLTFRQLNWAPERKDYITETVSELFLGAVAVILTGDLK